MNKWPILAKAAALLASAVVVLLGAACAANLTAEKLEGSLRLNAPAEQALKQSGS